MFTHILRALPRSQTKPAQAELAGTRRRYLTNAPEPPSSKLPYPFSSFLQLLSAEVAAGQVVIVG
jgi:hypothetical protein